MVLERIFEHVRLLGFNGFRPGKNKSQPVLSWLYRQKKPVN